MTLSSLFSATYNTPRTTPIYGHGGRQYIPLSEDYMMNCDRMVLTVPRRPEWTVHDVQTVERLFEEALSRHNIRADIKLRENCLEISFLSGYPTKDAFIDRIVKAQSQLTPILNGADQPANHRKLDESGRFQVLLERPEGRVLTAGDANAIKILAEEGIEFS